MTALIVEYSPTEAALAGLRSKYNRSYEVVTAAGMREAKEARSDLRKWRSDLEKERVRIKAPALERCKAIDSEARRITQELRALEDPINEAIKAEEEKKEAKKKAEEEAKKKAEEERRIKGEEEVAKIKNYPLIALLKSEEEILNIIKEVETIDTTACVMVWQATQAKDEALNNLERMYSEKVKYLAEKKKLETQVEYLNGLSPNHEVLKQQEREKDRVAEAVEYLRAFISQYEDLYAVMPIIESIKAFLGKEMI